MDVVAAACSKACSAIWKGGERERTDPGWWSARCDAVGSSNCPSRDWEGFLLQICQDPLEPLPGPIILCQIKGPHYLALKGKQSL